MEIFDPLDIAKTGINQGKSEHKISDYVDY
jgi:hypothetical protein